jgi:hypothetical protein
MEAIDQKTIGKYQIEIFPDDYPLNPRTDYDPLGSMICFHRRYSLGDDHNFNDPDDAREFLKSKEIAIVLPLYLYDHSGITMSVNPFSCPWDSGQVGWIYITKEKIREEYHCKRISKKMIERVKGYLINEVKTYDEYLTGDVYGFRITDTETDEEVESCWGFFGDDNYCMSEAESIVKHIISRSAVVPDTAE